MRYIKGPVTKALSWRVFVRPGKRLVFLYHDVSEPEDFQHSSLYSTTVSEFREQLQFLAARFNFITLDQILSAELQPGQKPWATMTFDDGFLSVRKKAMAYLNEMGIPFAVFLNRMAIVENRLFNDSENGKLERRANEKIFLDEGDVRSMSRAGVIIGSHTSTHRNLAQCDQQALCEEIDDNKTYLEQLTGLPVRHIALPFGKREHYSDRVVEHCRRAGHEFIFSTNPTFFDLSSRHFEDRIIPRISLTGQTPAETTFMINRPLVKRIDL